MSRTYVCPGASQAISRSVHLARLAAGDATCAACPHRNDLGGLALPPRTAHVAPPDAPLFERERVWRSLRQAGARREVLDAAAAVGAILWQTTPWELPLNDWDAAESNAPIGPTVAIADDGSRDGRSFAVELLREVRRGGSRVIALGTVPRPALDFAVDALDCTAGVHVLGGGAPAGVGFTVTGRGGMPWSKSGQMGAVARLLESGHRRPSRMAGSLKSFDIQLAYREGLVRHFGTATIPAVGVVGMSEAQVRIWEPLSARIGLAIEPIATAARFETEPGADIVKPLLDEVVRRRLSGGVIIGADERQVWVVDRREGLWSPQQLGRRLADELRRDRPDRVLKVAVAESSMWTDVNVPGVRTVFCGSTFEELVGTMTAERAGFACDGAGRFWIADPTPRCDALLTLAYIARSWARSMQLEAAA